MRLILLTCCLSDPNPCSASQWLDQVHRIFSGFRWFSFRHHRTGGECKAQCIPLIFKIENYFFSCHLIAPVEGSIATKTLTRGVPPMVRESSWLPSKFIPGLIRKSALPNVQLRKGLQ